MVIEKISSKNTRRIFKAPTPDAYTGNETTQRLLLPEEAWNIDKKSDDGKPGTGNIIALFWNSCTDASAADDFEADYLLNLDTVECSLHFINSINKTHINLRSILLYWLLYCNEAVL